MTSKAVPKQEGPGAPAGPKKTLTRSTSDPSFDNAEFLANVEKNTRANLEAMLLEKEKEMGSGGDEKPKPEAKEMSHEFEALK